MYAAQFLDFPFLSFTDFCAYIGALMEISKIYQQDAGVHYQQLIEQCGKTG